MTCKYIQYTPIFNSAHTGEEFIIYYNANCKTENIIYLLECAICGLQYVGETKHNNLVNAWMATEAMQIANLTFHSADFSDQRATMILSASWWSPWLTITPGGMLKAERKGKASGLENLRRYHRMQSMRKSNIISWLQFLLVSSSSIMTHSLLNWPRVYIPQCGGPFIEWVWASIPLSKIFLTVLFDTLTYNVSFLFFILHLFKCVAILCIDIIVWVY